MQTRHAPSFTRLPAAGRRRVAAWLLLLLAAGLPQAVPAALAQQKPPAQPAKTHAELVQECMNDVMRGLKAGQVLTTHQRMQSEMQCKAYADSKK